MSATSSMHRPVPTEVITARLVLFCLLLGSMILPAIPFTALLAAAYIWFALFSDGRANREAFALATPFVALGILGLIMSADNQRYEILKDTWYVAKLALCLAVGVLLGRREADFTGFHVYLVLLGVSGAALSLVILPVMASQQLFGINPELAGILPLVALAAVPLLLERIRSEKSAWRWRELLAIALIALAALMSDSRITLLGLVLMVVAWAGVFASLKKAMIGGIILVLLSLLAWQMLPEYQGGELTAFNKIRRSLEEIMFTDAYDGTAMIMNWRGFEAYNAQLMFDYGSVWEKLFGFGLGAEVNLGFAVQMSQEMMFQYLPTLHNGFYYILIKFGIVGLVIYTWAVLRWFRWRELSDARSTALDARMLRGMVVIVIASTAVITGLFNKEELHGITLLIAFILGHLSRYRKSKPSLEGGAAAPMQRRPQHALIR